MTKVVALAREREIGESRARPGSVSTSTGNSCRAAHLPGYCLMAMLACAGMPSAQAEDSLPAGNAGTGDWEQPAPAPSRHATAAPSLERPPSMIGESDYDVPLPPQSARAIEPQMVDEPAPGPLVAARTGDTEPSAGRAQQRLLLHLDDASTATGLPESRARAVALAFDAVVPRGGGLTIQPRVQVAYQPGATNATQLAAGDALGDRNSTGLGVRLYGVQPTRLAGVYPFVEADWWQDSRKQTLNINGTKIDTDLLRGLFSFNIGAHSSTSTGTKLWFKVRAGHNPGATVGARYKW